LALLYKVELFATTHEFPKRTKDPKALRATVFPTTLPGQLTKIPSDPLSVAVLPLTALLPSKVVLPAIIPVKAFWVATLPLIVLLAAAIPYAPFASPPSAQKRALEVGRFRLVAISRIENPSVQTGR
jgi:hypothetical protein